ncbi:ankyrin repeat-containing domain protein [Panaeolus papilionaceus]|nr:ankyrin repeat-containing domain protein [Panaeolus papilionaceus]
MNKHSWLAHRTIQMPQTTAATDMIKDAVETERLFALLGVPSVATGKTIPVNVVDIVSIGRLLISRGADTNARDKANQLPLHRAATTGSIGFIRMLLDSSNPSNKLRLNTADRVGNTPLHLAMDSAHAEAAILLINAGADRTRENLDGETPENVPGVGGQEQKMARQHVIEQCGKPE